MFRRKNKEMDKKRERDKFSSEALNRLHQVFTSFDKDGDGQINAQELYDALSSLGFTSSTKEVQEMIASIDKNGGETIDFKEFLAMMAKRRRYQAKDAQEMRQAFTVFDKNGDGYITRDELKTVLQSLGEKLCDADLDVMMQEADMDKDGRINYEEFAMMLTSNKMFQE